MGKRLTYANAMSTIAVFIALGGASALAVNKIGSAEIQNRAVRTQKIADLAVTRRKIDHNAVTGDKVKETTLAEVPSSKTAERADTLDGIDSSAFGRVVHSEVDSGAFRGEGLTAGGVVRAAQITAPQDGYLMIVGSGDAFYEGSGHISPECWLEVDRGQVPGTRRTGYLSQDVRRQDCATNGVLRVAAGQHFVALSFNVVDQFGGVQSASLDVAFIPFEG